MSGHWRQLSARAARTVQALSPATRALAGTGALTSALLTAHAAINLALIRRPQNAATQVTERVSILIPARNEADRIADTLRGVLAQEGLPNLEIVVLDDGSTDDTARIVKEIADGDPRVRLMIGPNETPPEAWLGKSWACYRLAQESTGTVLVFIDADVHLAPHAVASTVRMMRDGELDLLSPYPHQIAVTWAERLTQPMVTWSWMNVLPARLTETKHYPSMAAAIGQFLVVDARAYRISGGHAAVSDMILEDVGVLRALKRAGFRGTPADGSAVARCRMYTGPSAIYEGYTKSVWSAFRPEPAAYGLMAFMLLAYVAPPVFAVAGPDRRTRMWGLAGYSCGVAGRVLVARRTGERIWPDCYTQPASVAAFVGLLAASLRGHRAGTLTWRGRLLP